MKSWKEEDWVLELFCDAAYADLKQEKYGSTGGYVLYLNETPVRWKSKKIKLQCTSSAEAEYFALFLGVRDAIGTA